MATHASIVKVAPDGKSADMIQCLLSGGIDFTGTMLDYYYDDPSKVDKLISLGMIEVLGENLEHVPGPFWKSTSVWRPGYRVHIDDFEKFHQDIIERVLKVEIYDREAIDVSYCYLMIPDADGNYTWYVKDWEHNGEDYVPLDPVVTEYWAKQHQDDQ